ncbi:hypothetical protein [Nonomuraea endophytica]|uniref:Uncharacterized protein n=1 Tax=Nonomuraea endophytica TaxID=714136 RepID=A0A7W8EL96_9ACTN|nr:hypothetical protein [Nonomuraea endophytica]MBB5083153.1 hypothetical protein [Nonomuraea endophytica]
MAVDERTIGDGLRRLAGRAEPVDGEMMAALVLRSAGRRRRTGWAVGVAGTAAALAFGAVAVTNLPDPGDRTVAEVDPTFTGLTLAPTPPPATAPPIEGLPANTPEQFRQVRDCMPQGGPVHGMDGERRVPQHGVAEDFRLLAESRDKLGVTQLMGSRKGLVLCTPGVLDVSYPERPIFTYWGHEEPGSLAFDGPLAVDVHGTQTQSEVNPGTDGDPVFMVVAGRAAERVRRVEIAWASGQRMEASLSGGFFIARTRVTKRSATLPKVDVTAYDADGKVLDARKGLENLFPGALDVDD